MTLQTFQKTGKHPALEGRDAHVLPTLPVRDPNRPHVFLSFASGKADLGRPAILKLSYGLSDGLPGTLTCMHTRQAFYSRKIADLQ